MTEQERRIIQALRARPQGWRCSDLADELSRGRREPMSQGALSVHIHNLREQGYTIKCHRIYALGEKL
jgi:hypothetical protein